MNNLTFYTPDLSSFCQLNKLGLVATGQHITESYAVIECRFTQSPEPCPKCATRSVSRGTVDRRLAHVPYGQRSTTLLLRIRRFSCACNYFWHEDYKQRCAATLKTLLWGDTLGIGCYCA